MPRILVACLGVLLLAGCEAPHPAPMVDADLLAARAAHTATVLSDGVVLVAGGCVVDGCTTASAEAFAVASGIGSRLGDMATPRDSHTATLLPSGGVLVTGGFTAEGTAPQSSAELFDSTTGAWRTVGSMSVGRGGHAAATLGNGGVAVVGGWVRSRTYTAAIDLYNPETGTFDAGPDLDIAVDGLAAVSLDDGRVLITGGQSAPGVASGQAAILSADGRMLVSVGPLLVARFKHTMVALDDGRVLVIGGTSDDYELLTSTEIFDPATNTFTPGPELHHGRYKLAGGAALLPDGRVVVGGGGDGIEVLDPAHGTSTISTSAAGRASFGTISVVGTDVLLLGGYDERIALTRRFIEVPVSAL